MSRLGWWELAQLSDACGFARVWNCGRLINKLLTSGRLLADELYSDGSKVGAGGRLRPSLHISPSGMGVVAAYAGTPQALEFRRGELVRLAKLQEATLCSSSAALVSPSATPTEHTLLSHLIGRLEAVEQRLTHVERIEPRVEKLETRRPKQLSLPLGDEPDAIATHTAFVAAFEKLQTAINGPNPTRGLTTAEIQKFMDLGHVSALELREAIRSINGGVVPRSPVSLGRLIQSVCNVAGGVEGHWSHGHVRRWVVPAKGMH